METIEKYKPEIATGIVAVGLGYLTKHGFKMETLNVDSFSKVLGSFVVVVAAGVGYKMSMAERR